jgi:hypothetical protein
VEHWLGWALAIPANIRLGQKGSPGTNTLAYYEKYVNYDRKKFFSIGPSVHSYKTFTTVINISAQISLTLNRANTLV